MFNASDRGTTSQTIYESVTKIRPVIVDKGILLAVGGAVVLPMPLFSYLCVSTDSLGRPLSRRIESPVGAGSMAETGRSAPSARLGKGLPASEAISDPREPFSCVEPND